MSKITMNIINAIINLTKEPITELMRHYSSKNRANSMGDALEEYVKDLFAGSFYLPDSERHERLAQVFSYLGNTNNPPDAMLRGGDAIEVKKIENNNSFLALNSSYPKSKLFANSPMISNACRQAEDWVQKDIIYVVGMVQGDTVRHLLMFYGDDYFAQDSFYKKALNDLTDGIDPLNITKINHNTKCHIKNPYEYFDIRAKDLSKFHFDCIINHKKWLSFSNRQVLENISSIRISNIAIPSPNNPFFSIDAKRISYTY